MSAFGAGRYADMEAAARAWLELDADDGRAMKAFGVALQLQGRDALAVLLAAAQRLPRDAELLATVGSVYASRGDAVAAADWLRRAVRLHPSSAIAHANLADVWLRLHRPADAEAAARRAIARQPGLAVAHLHLGRALLLLRRADAATAPLQRAVDLAPTLAEAHAALAATRLAQRQWAAAVGPLRRVAELRPHDASAWLQLGIACTQAGDAPAAVAALQRAAALATVEEQREIAVPLGAALLDAGDAASSETTLRRALAARPDFALAHTQLGQALAAQRRWTEAIAAQRDAVAAAPTVAELRANLAHALKTVGDPAAALQQLDRAIELHPDEPQFHSEAIFVAQYVGPGAEGGATASARAARWAGVVGARAGLPRRHRPATAHDRDRRLRVGFLSPDLRAHPVGHFVESVFAALAAEPAAGVEVHAYSSHRRGDDTTARLRRHVAAWRDVADLDDAALAKCIADDRVDVLVDLAGHTRGSRLAVLARRPAPVQACWLGWCATTGLTAVDAFVADPHIVPAGDDGGFVERVERLPDTFLCFTPPRESVAVGALPALAGGGLRLACFNQLAKIGDDVVAAFCRVLQALPGSRLVLRAAALDDAAVRAAWHARYAAHGVPAERVELLGAVTRADYLAAYRDIDIALDPFPYPGGTTTVEALWMGVPVVTLAGASALARQGVSILRNVGLDEWIAADVDDYVARAVARASDLPALAALRAALRDRLLASPLVDSQRFARELEACLRRMWLRRCDPAPRR